MPPLGRWVLAFAVPSVLSVVTTFLALRWIFRRELRGKIEHEAEAIPLSREGKLVLAALAAVVAVLLAASAMDKDLGLPTCVAALVVAAIVSITAWNNPLKLAAEISWATLLLVAGLFVMVDAVESVGATRITQEWLTWAQHLGNWTATMITGFVVGVANNIVNNLPLGLLAGSSVQVAHLKGLLTEAVLIGVDLGPNLSITGSLATILWLIALRKENLNVSFWDFLKIGAVVMPVALFSALSGAIAMHLLFQNF
jgi:arsenical pump membrane protein